MAEDHFYGDIDMQRQPEKINHQRDGEVWVNPTTEALRKDECLCLNGCARMKPGQPDHCEIAARLYIACIDGKTALIVTRCSLYVPIA